MTSSYVPTELQAYGDLLNPPSKSSTPTGDFVGLFNNFPVYATKPPDPISIPGQQWYDDNSLVDKATGLGVHQDDDGSYHFNSDGENPANLNGMEPSKLFASTTLGKTDWNYGDVYRGNQTTGTNNGETVSALWGGTSYPMGRVTNWAHIDPTQQEAQFTAGQTRDALWNVYDNLVAKGTTPALNPDQIALKLASDNGTGLGRNYNNILGYGAGANSLAIAQTISTVFMNQPQVVAVTQQPYTVSPDSVNKIGDFGTAHNSPQVLNTLSTFVRQGVNSDWGFTAVGIGMAIMGGMAASSAITSGLGGATVGTSTVAATTAGVANTSIAAVGAGAVSGAINAGVQGGDILKGALTGAFTSALGLNISPVAKSLVEASNGTINLQVAQAAVQAAAVAAKAGFTGGDVTKAIINSLEGSAISAEMKDMNIPSNIAKIVSPIVLTGLNNGDVNAAIQNSLISYGMGELKSGVSDIVDKAKETIKDAGIPTIASETPQTIQSAGIPSIVPETKVETAPVVPAPVVPSPVVPAEPAPVVPTPVVPEPAVPTPITDVGQPIAEPLPDAGLPTLTPDVPIAPPTNVGLPTLPPVATPITDTTSGLPTLPPVDNPVAPTPEPPAPVVSEPVPLPTEIPTPVVSEPVAPITEPSEPVAPAPVVSEPVLPEPVSPTPETPAPVAPTPEPTPVTPAPVAPTPVATAPVVDYVDANGNAFSKDGTNLGSYSALGLLQREDSSGKTFYFDTSGNVIPTQGGESPIVASPAPIANSGSPTGFVDANNTVVMRDGSQYKDGTVVLGQEQSGDYPLSITHNEDGSVTTKESDGSTNTINTDGTITTTSKDGIVSDPLNPPKNVNVLSDGKGGFTDKTGNPVTSDGTPLTLDSNGNLLLPDGTIYSYAPSNTSTSTDGKETTKSTDTSGISGLGNVVKGLLGTATTGTTTGTTGTSSAVPIGMTAAGLLALATAAKQGTSSAPAITQMADVKPSANFSWNQQEVAAPIDGKAMGQTYVSPTFSTGGNVPNLGIPSISHTHHIAQQLKDEGHPVDHLTIAKIEHLNSIGAHPEHIKGFLKHMHKLAGGGSLGGYSDGGHFLKGPGDGMSDDIPARIGEKQEARLANEEFVIPADVVSHLGNGSSESGAKVLYHMMDKVRKARTGTTKQGKQINPLKFLPK